MNIITQSSTTIEYALLGFLYHHAMHGYEIAQVMGEPERLGRVWRVKLSQLYALLAKLEKEGLVVATLEPQEARPPRKVFELTEMGREVFAEWVREPVENGRSLRLDFLVKLYFAQQMGLETAQYLIQQQQAMCGEWLAEQQTIATQTQGSNQYEWLVCQFRIGQIEAMIAWLNQCEQTLNGQ